MMDGQAHIELSRLLATALFRAHVRRTDRHVEKNCKKAEKVLDDVTQQATVVSERDSNPGERRPR